MENEIKVNEFVRTKDGQIYKIEDGTEFYEDSVDVGLGIIPEVEGIWVDKEHFTYVDKRDIVKHSPNLIDLIEEGDYVNGSRVIEIDNCKGAMRELYLEGQNPEKDCGIYFEQIETIVTKEQMAQMEYKVKD